MAKKVHIIPCSELQDYLDKYDSKIVHIVHAPMQCGIGVPTDKMILVIEE